MLFIEGSTAPRKGYVSFPGRGDPILTERCSPTGAAVPPDVNSSACGAPSSSMSCLPHVQYSQVWNMVPPK